ncbi:MAG: regulatory protein RecX [Saccharofermentanales bacterium]
MKTIFSDYKKSPQEKDFEIACGKARMAAVTYIGVSRKTSGRIAEWLGKKGFSAIVVKYVINEMINDGTINDAMLAAAILKSRRNGKSESAAASYQRLIRLGIDRDIARECLNEVFNDDSKEISDAISLLHLKFNSKIDTIRECDRLEQFKFKQKCFRFLLSRGYNREIAFRAMNNVFKDFEFNE